MKMFVDCPKCGDALLIEYIEDREGRDSLLRSCVSRVGHKFVCLSETYDHDMVRSIGLEIDPSRHMKASWIINTQELIITVGPIKTSKTFRLPYFEPNFSNYKKLIEKIKTYITFS